MKIWLLLVLLSAHHRQQCDGTEAVNEQEFLHAVLNSYDVNISFTENVLAIMTIFCPASVQCANQNNTEMNNYTLLKNERHAANFSHDCFLNRQRSPIAKARTILENNLNKLDGSCIRCACDTDCVGRQNCCPALGKDFQQSKPQVPQTCMFTELNHNPKTKPKGYSYFIVTDCTSNTNRHDSANKCTFPNFDIPEEATPVYSALTKRNYRNKYCADCYADNHLTPWQTIIAATKLTFVGKHALPSTFHEMYALGLHEAEKYDIYFVPPSNMSEEIDSTLKCKFRDHKPISFEKCDAALGLDDDEKYYFKQACAVINYTFFSKCDAYQNVFCFLCASRIYEDPSEICGDDLSFDDTAATPSFMFILSPDIELTDSNEMPCTCTEHFVLEKKTCRKLLCPPGEIYKGCECVNVFRQERFIRMKLYVQIIPTLPMSAGFYNGSEGQSSRSLNFGDAIVKALFLQDLGDGVSQNYDLFVFRETSITNNSYIKFHVILSIDYLDNKAGIQILLGALKEGVSTEILNVPMQIFIGRIFGINRTFLSTGETLGKLINSSDIVLEPIPWYSEFIEFMYKDSFIDSQTITKLLICKRVELVDAEMFVLTNNPETLGISEPYLSYIFLQEDGSMCLEDYERAFAGYTSGSPHDTQATVVLIVIFVITGISNKKL